VSSRPRSMPNRDLADNATDFVYAMDLEGRFTYVNDAGAQFIGIPAQAMLGVSLTNKSLVEHPEKSGRPRAAGTRRGRRIGTALPGACEDARTEPAGWKHRSPASRAPTAASSGSAASAANVTDAPTQPEDALRRRVERFRTVVQTSAPNGMVVVVGTDRSPVAV